MRNETQHQSIVGFHFIQPNQRSYAAISRGIIGGAVGGVVGFVALNLSSTAAILASSTIIGAVSNTSGQVIGNWASGNSAFENFLVTQVIASSAAGVLTAPLSGIGSAAEVGLIPGILGEGIINGGFSGIVGIFTSTVFDGNDANLSASPCN